MPKINNPFTDEEDRIILNHFYVVDESGRYKENLAEVLTLIGPGRTKNRVLTRIRELKINRVLIRPEPATAKLCKGEWENTHGNSRVEKVKRKLTEKYTELQQTSVFNPNFGLLLNEVNNLEIIIENHSI